jgi:hypothetical protein
MYVYLLKDNYITDAGLTAAWNEAASNMDKTIGDLAKEDAYTKAVLTYLVQKRMNGHPVGTYSKAADDAVIARIQKAQKSTDDTSHAASMKEYQGVAANRKAHIALKNKDLENAITILKAKIKADGSNRAPASLKRGLKNIQEQLFKREMHKIGEHYKDETILDSRTMAQDKADIKELQNYLTKADYNKLIDLYNICTKTAVDRARQIAIQKARQGAVLSAFLDWINENYIKKEGGDSDSVLRDVIL